MKKSVFSVAVLMCLFVLLFSVAGCGGAKTGAQGSEGETKQETKRVSIVTASTSGAWYPLGGAFANAISKYVPNMEATAEVGAASVENVRRMHAGDVELAFMQPDVAYDAYFGYGAFEKNKMDSIRSLFSTNGTLIQVVTTNPNINSMADLKGKKVGVGPPGSGTEGTSKSILEIFGITYNDIDEQFLSVPEQIDAIKDNQLDVSMGNMPIPTGIITDLSLQHNVKLLPIEGDVKDRFIKKYPYFYETIIPSDTYKGVNENITTVAFRGIVYGTSRLTDQEAYDILKAIWDNRDEWKDVHSVTSDINLETALEGIPSPLHPGAVKFYREQGINIPVSILPPGMN